MAATSRFPVFVSGIILGAGVSVAAVYTIYNYKSQKSDKTSPGVKNDTELSSVSPQLADDSVPDYTSLHQKAEYRHTGIQESDIYPNIDSNSSLYDSLFTGTTNDLPAEVPDNTGRENIKTEKLLSVSKIKLVIRTAEKAPTKSDSIISKNNDVRLEPANQTYDVEFWQSPLNSKGYRMGKNKLALYGLNPSAGISLFQLPEGLFLQADNETYQLQKSSEFRNFKTVSDPAILKQLNR